MGMRCATVSVVIVALLIFSIPRRSGARQGANGLFTGSHDLNLAPLSDFEEEMVEHILSNCELDFLGIKYAMRAVSSPIPDDNTASTMLDFEELLFHSRDLQESNFHLYTEMKGSLIDCLIKQNLLVPIFGGSNSINAEHMARVLNQGPLLRKHLAGQSATKNFPSTFPDSVLPRRRIQASEASSAPFDGINHITLQPPSEAPSPKNDPENFSPAPASGDHLEPEVNNSVSPIAITPSEHTSSKKKAIIIAVVVTATVTLTFAAICFCCFYKYLERKYQFGNQKRDERPLLSLSLSDFSGSPHVTIGKNGALSFKVDPNQNVQVVSTESPTEPHVDKEHSTISSLTEPTSAPSLSSIPSYPPPLPLKKLPDRMVSSPPPLLHPKPPPAPPSPMLPKVGPLLPKGAPPPPQGGPPPPKGAPPQLKGGPPPPKGPPRPPQPSLSPSKLPGNSSQLSANAIDSHSSKTKLKPFFWDKVMTNPDQSMVWHQIKSGSFQFNEEMIETLFGYDATDKRWSDAKKDLASNHSSNYIQILDPKKAQNLAIFIKARNVNVEEICDALLEGNELPVELLQTLLRLAPTADEELKLRLFNGNTTLLGPAEHFLKTIINIPFAFKRMDALLLMAILQEESTYVKESLTTLEEACKELRNSRLFLKLLEAVLKTGNRMNDGTYRGRAQAFKLDTLLKLSDVKGADGKTTLLHFVVQEIVRSEGKRAVRVARENRGNSSTTISNFNSNDFVEVVPEESEDHYHALGLRVVSGLKNELDNVKKAAGLDAEALTGAVANLGLRLMKTKEFLNTDMRNLEEESGFHDSLKAFVTHAETDITSLLEAEKRIKSLVKSTADYFYGTAGKDDGLRLFVIVRDFLGMVDKICKEVKEAPKKEIRTTRNKDNPTLQPILKAQQILFPTIKDPHEEGFSSDD